MRPSISLLREAEIETARHKKAFHALERKLRLTGMRRRPPY